MSEDTTAPAVEEVDAPAAPAEEETLVIEDAPVADDSTDSDDDLDDEDDEDFDADDFDDLDDEDEEDAE